MNGLIARFIKHRSHLKRSAVEIRLIQPNCIFINNPIIVADFCGYCKNRNPKKEIYFRGESHDHEHIIPSLFRSKGLPLTDNKILKARITAYNELKQEVKTRFESNVSRFKYEDIDNLFQHYGIRSPVIDMVDNIYTAIWFAMDGNKSRYGYIRILDASSEDLNVFDLRKTHSSLSLRLHTQHGLIAKKKVAKWNKTNIFYDNYEIAKVKFPVNKQIENGILFSKQNIYPDVTLDNTFKILKKATWLPSTIDKLEKKYGLKKGDLGSIN